MFKYTKKDVIDIATKNGFIVNNTEKVLHLCDILNHFSNSTLNDYLALKGGTAINLFLLDLPRLSIDIDFDFAKAITKEEMLSVRDIVKKNITDYMLSEGYSVNPKTKYTHSLDSFVFSYHTLSGSQDILKIEINYSNRVHVLDTVQDERTIKLGKTVSTNRLATEELVASKLGALIGRTTPRDIYDVHRIINQNICDFNIVRKITIFYVMLSADIPFDFPNAINICLQRIASIDFHKVRETLLSLLRKEEKLNIEEMKSNVSSKIAEMFQLSEKERMFIEKFNKGEYVQELLFDNMQIEDLSLHPMIVWKLNNR